LRFLGLSAGGRRGRGASIAGAAVYRRIEKVQSPADPLARPVPPAVPSCKRIIGPIDMLPRHALGNPGTRLARVPHDDPDAKCEGDGCASGTDNPD
jgi:hypothetical protein